MSSAIDFLEEMLGEPKRAQPPGWLLDAAVLPTDVGLHVFVVSVTPEVARLMLDREIPNQRKMKLPHIVELAWDMAEKKWGLTGEPIIFTGTGKMNNGGHRCRACIKADTPFDTMVVWGVDDSTTSALDQIANRTHGQVLQMGGEKNANALSASLDGLADYLTYGTLYTTQTPTPSVKRQAALLMEYPDIRESVSWVKSRSRVRLGIQIKYFILLHFLATENGGEADAEAFLNMVWTGRDLADGDPILVLRSMLIKDNLSRRKAPVQDRVAWLVKAWNAWVERRTVKVMKFGVNETFPVLNLRAGRSK